MREFILIVTAVIIIALVAVVFVIMYINHNKKTVSPTSRQLFITKSKKTKPKIIQKIIL